MHHTVLHTHGDIYLFLSHSAHFRDDLSRSLVSTTSPAINTVLLSRDTWGTIVPCADGVSWLTSPPSCEALQVEVVVTVSSKGSPAKWGQRWEALLIYISIFGDPELHKSSFVFNCVFWGKISFFFSVRCAARNGPKMPGSRTQPYPSPASVFSAPVTWCARDYQPQSLWTLHPCCFLDKSPKRLTSNSTLGSPRSAVTSIYELLQQKNKATPRAPQHVPGKRRKTPRWGRRKQELAESSWKERSKRL